MINVVAMSHSGLKNNQGSSVCIRCLFDSTRLLGAVQHEISLDAYNRLTSTPDAKGRKIEVIKAPIPYPLFRTHKEADGVHVSATSCVHATGADAPCIAVLCSAVPTSAMVAIQSACTASNTCASFSTLQAL